MCGFEGEGADAFHSVCAFCQEYVTINGHVSVLDST